MELTVLIKEEIKEEALDDTATFANVGVFQEETAALHLNDHLDQLSLSVKEEFQLEAELCEELPESDSSLVSYSDDDSDSAPSDWLWGASDEETVEESVTLTAASVSNFHIKVEPLPDDAVSLSTFASPQPASPFIIVKGETCACPGGDCLDCLQTDPNDSEEGIVDAPGAVVVAPVTNSCATTSTRSPPCPECGKTFASNSDLKRHLRVHTGERPYVCDQCQKAFKVLRTLEQHQLTHQAVRSRPFKCTAEGCGKNFTTKQYLTRHFRSHTGERPYQCDNCGKTFTTKQYLTRHFQSHTGEKPHQCDACGKAFTTSRELTVHFHTHTGERPYTCPLCPKAFADPSNARRHQRTVHPTAP